MKRNQYLVTSAQRDTTSRLMTRYRGTGSSGRNTAGQPTVITPPAASLYLWWDSEHCYDGAGGTGSLITADGATIVSLYDISGNGRHGDQSTAGYRGTYETNEINTTLPCIRLTADNSRYYQYTISPNRAEPWTLYLVTRPSAWAASMCFTNMDGSSYSAYLEQATAADNARMRYGGAGFGDRSITVGSWSLAMQVINGASSFLKVNNAANGTGSTAGYTYNRICIGYGATYSCKQDVACLLAYVAAHSDTSGDGLLVRNYLNAKYGVTI